MNDIIEPDSFVPMKPTTDPREALVEALNKAGNVMGQNFLDYIAIKAYDNDKIALKLLDKLVPSLQSQQVQSQSEVTVSIKDIIKQNQEEYAVPDTLDYKLEIEEEHEVEIVNLPENDIPAPEPKDIDKERLNETED